MRKETLLEAFADQPDVVEKIEALYAAQPSRKHAKHRDVGRRVRKSHVIAARQMRQDGIGKSIIAERLDLWAYQIGKILNGRYDHLLTT